MAALENFNLPPAVVPTSPLDDHNDHRVPTTLDSRVESHAPNQHRSQPQHRSQTQLHQPLLQPRNPFGDNAEAASVASSTATSQLPSYANTTAANRYGIHRNEEEYLAALRAWAEEKQYVQLDKKGGLPGFYGNEELKDRAERMKMERKEEKEMKLRRKMERRGTVTAPVDGVQGSPGGKGRSSVAHFFRRQSNAV